MSKSLRISRKCDVLTKGESSTFTNDMLFQLKVDCTFDVNRILLDRLMHIVA